MRLNEPAIFIGCAGWSLGREHWPAFPAGGTHLQRYAARFNCVEINSSFYRPHRRQTYERWANSVAPDFRFAVKVPKLITHEQRLADSAAALDEFLGQCQGLGDRLGCLLVQLPPKLAFEAPVAEAFFRALRERFQDRVVLEPRHESWTDAEAMLVDLQIAQAVVDPSRISTDTAPGGWQGLHYWRLHGSPRIYHSAYEAPWLQQLAQNLRRANAEGKGVWCIFDNTASGAATADALDLKALIEDRSP